MALCLGAEVPNRALIRWRGESQTKAPEFEFEDSVSPPDARQKQLTQLDFLFIYGFFSCWGWGVKIQQGLLRIVFPNLDSVVLQNQQLMHCTEELIGKLSTFQQVN